MTIKFLLDVFREGINKPAIIWNEKPYPYGWMLQHVSAWLNELSGRDIPPGSVVILEADYSPEAVALFLALIEHSCILVPLAGTAADKAERVAAVQGEYRISADERDRISFERLAHQATHKLYATLCRRGHPGLIVFPPGRAGNDQAALHDLTGMLEKYKVRRPARRTIPFLRHDHLGGIHTLLHVLSNHGTLVVVPERSPEAVLAAVEKHKVELLPATPAFIEQMLQSEACKGRDLSSLRMVTYGGRPMPEDTLRRFHETFPTVLLKQAYGLAEVGVLHSKVKEPGSPWIKVGGEGFETRVVDGVLQIKAQSAMLGYLNAPSPFTEDGWFPSGDAVEVDGEYLRILERTGDERG